MSRSKNQHDKSWNPSNRFLKEATKSKRRSAEKRYLKKLYSDPSYYDKAEIQNEKELEDVWNWD